MKHYDFNTDLNPCFCTISFWPGLYLKMFRKCPEAQMVTNRTLLKELVAIATLALARLSMLLCVNIDLLSEGAHSIEKGECHMRSFEPL